jgi:hypothetical protein
VRSSRAWWGRRALYVADQVDFDGEGVAVADGDAVEMYIGRPRQGDRDLGNRERRRLSCGCPGHCTFSHLDRRAFRSAGHTGNTFAAASGARLRDLMARMGHDSERPR